MKKAGPYLQVYSTIHNFSAEWSPPYTARHHQRRRGGGPRPGTGATGGGGPPRGGWLPYPPYGCGVEENEHEGALCPGRPHEEHTWGYIQYGRSHRRQLNASQDRKYLLDALDLGKDLWINKELWGPIAMAHKSWSIVPQFELLEAAIFCLKARSYANHALLG